MGITPKADLSIPDLCILYNCSLARVHIPLVSPLMPFFGLVWATSWVSYLLTSSQGLFKVPDYLVSTFPSKVLSVVNNPIELPTPVFSTTFYSRVWSSHPSVAALPNIAFGMSAAPPLPWRSQLSLAAVSPPVRANAGENTFCHPESKQKQPESSLPIASIAYASSAYSEHTPALKASKATLSEQLWQVVQNLLPRRQRSESLEQSIASSVMVISTHAGNLVGENPNSKGRVNQGFLQYSQRLRKQSVAPTAPKEKELFQVWVKKKLIAQFPKQQQAELMAQRLKQFFSQPSDSFLNTSSIEPAIFEKLPAVKIGDRLLFKIDDTLAKALNRNPELIAIDWVNNLRTALGKTTLSLAEAQQKMHKLLETSKKFEGKASWYGTIFHGRPTATGETYDQHELTAAHPTLPFDTFLKVKNRKNGNSVIVRINDRGPYIPGRALDLSREAARCLKSEKAGVIPFEAVIMKPSSSKPTSYITKN